jgi:hypothetical protein
MKIALPPFKHGQKLIKFLTGLILTAILQGYRKFRLEESTMKVLGMFLLLAGAASSAMAAVPEVGVGSAGSALALLSGALLVVRGRRKK